MKTLRTWRKKIDNPNIRTYGFYILERYYSCSWPCSLLCPWRGWYPISRIERLCRPLFYNYQWEAYDPKSNLLPNGAPIPTGWSWVDAKLEGYERTELCFFYPTNQNLCGRLIQRKLIRTSATAEELEVKEKVTRIVTNVPEKLLDGDKLVTGKKYDEYFPGTYTVELQPKRSTVADDPSDYKTELTIELILYALVPVGSKLSPDSVLFQGQQEGWARIVETTPPPAYVEH